MTRPRRPWLTFFTLVCIAGFLLTYTIMNVYGFDLYCNTDMYADTLISKLIWEEKTLFPDGWVFSNQYYVAATPVLAALFYGLTGNTNLATVLATEVMTLLIFLSFFYLVRSFTKKALPYWVGMLALMASTIAPDIPNNDPAQIFFLQASYYACYLITFFVVVGDYVRTLDSQKPRIGAWILSLLLCLAMGIQSLRQTAAMCLPILACELFLALRRLIQKQKPWTRENRLSLLRSLSYLGANLLGVGILAWIDPLHTAVYGSSGLTPFGQLWGRVKAIWPAFRDISGLSYGFGEGGSPLLAGISLFFLSMVVIAAVLWLLRIRRQETPLEMSWLVCLVGLAATALSTVVTLVNIRHIYLFLWYPLVALSVILVLEKLKPHLQTLLVTLLCLVSLGTLFHGYTRGAETALENSDSYAGRAFHLARYYGYKTDAYTDEDYPQAQALCQWALDQGYQYVYGNWYTAPRIAVPSGGQLTAGYWWVESIFTPNDHLTSLHFYGPEENAKAIYVFTPYDEADCLAAARERGVEMEKVAQFGKYSAYTSPVALMDGLTPSYE